MVVQGNGSLPTVESAWKRLPLWKKTLVRLGCKVSVGSHRLPGWTSSLEFFLFQCRCGELHIDYPHGMNGYLLCISALSRRETDA